MNHPERDEIDYLTMVPVEYWYRGKCLLTVHSWVYPHYRVGDPLMFDIRPSDREKNRRPDDEFTSGYFVVQKVLHVVREPKLGTFTTKLEIILEDPPEGDDKAIAGFERKLVTDEGKPAIASRILRRPK
jgi:hypothetical protein